MYMLANYVDEIIKIRRELHKIPESGFNEFKTSNYIKKYLTSIDIVYKVYAKTGIVGYINVENEGDSIAFRSDIDALSLYEMTSHEFKSEHEGFMHACGHDGHMARNIIAEKAVLEGTLRAFDEKTYNLIKDKMNLQIEAIEKGFNCKVNIVFRDMYPAVINDEKLTEDFFYANSKDFDVEDIEPKMLAEDFSYYQKEIPGVFVFLGTKNIEKNHVFPLHNSKFDFDEKILINGVKSYINVLIYKKILMEE